MTKPTPPPDARGFFSFGARPDETITNSTWDHLGLSAKSAFVSATPQAGGFTPSEDAFAAYHDGSGFVDGATITIMDSLNRFGSKPYDPKPLLWTPCKTNDAPSPLGRVTSPLVAATGQSRYEDYWTQLHYTGTGGADGGGCLTGAVEPSDGINSQTYIYRIDSDEWAGSTYDWNSYGLKVYIFRKTRRTYPPTAGLNEKSLRVWGRNESFGTNQYPDMVNSWPNIFGAGEFGACGVEAVEASPPYDNFRLSARMTAAEHLAMYPVDTWYTEETAWKVNSDDASTDADFRIANNGGDWVANFPATTWDTFHLRMKRDIPYANDGRMRIALVCHSVIQGGVDHVMWDPQPAGNYFDHDDIYVDDSWCRVMVGDNADFTSCTLREIQIPTAWDSGGGHISCVLNLGEFASFSGKHLFVCTNDDPMDSYGNHLTSDWVQYIGQFV